MEKVAKTGNGILAFILLFKINTLQLSKQCLFVVEAATRFKMRPCFLWPLLGFLDSYRVEQ